jgi:hypothetical protein
MKPKELLQSISFEKLVSVVTVGDLEKQYVALTLAKLGMIGRPGHFSAHSHLALSLNTPNWGLWNALLTPA